VPHQLTPEQEQRLVTQARHAPPGMRELYQAYVLPVYAYIASRVGQTPDAEDLVSETFLKVVEGLHTFRWQGTQSFSAWLFRIAHNVVQDFFRQSYKQGTSVQLDDIRALPSTALLPDELVLQKEQFAHLYHLMRTISPRRQDIIALKFFGGLRNQDIATILALDERTVAAHLCRGLEELHRKYLHQEENAHEQTPPTF
jgi:RNA polymerase sigma-70 factor (ECF subfamily)